MTNRRDWLKKARKALTDAEYLSHICNSFARCNCEQGGILGFGSSPVFIRDASPLFSGYSEYVPNIDYLNHVVHDWRQAGIRFCGFVHTHPNGEKSLSELDIDYDREILPHFHSSAIFMFVVAFSEDIKSIFCYLVTRNNIESIGEGHFQIE